MKKFSIPVVAFLLLVGCATTTTDWIKTLAISCEAYASSLTVLAARRDAERLSPSQIRTVNAARAIVNPICKDDAVVPNPREAFFSITDSVGKLVAMKKET